MGFKVLSRLKSAFKWKHNSAKQVRAQPGSDPGKTVRFQEPVVIPKPSIDSRAKQSFSLPLPKAETSSLKSPRSTTLPSVNPRTPDRKPKGRAASAAPSTMLTEIDDAGFEKLVDELAARAKWFELDLQEAFAKMESKPLATAPESMQQKLAVQNSALLAVPAFLNLVSIPEVAESDRYASLDRNAIEIARLENKIAELESELAQVSPDSASVPMEAQREEEEDNAVLDYWSTGMSDISLPLIPSFAEAMSRVSFDDLNAFSWSGLYDEDKDALRRTFCESHCIEDAPMDLIQLAMKAQLGIADQNLKQNADDLPQALLSIDPDAPNALSDAAALAWYTARAEEELLRNQQSEDWLAPSDRLLPGLRDALDAKVDLYLDLRDVPRSGPELT